MDVKAFHVTISLMLAVAAWVGCGFIGIAYLSRGWRERDKRARAVGLLWFVVPTLIMAVWSWPHIAYLWTEHQWRAHFSNPDGEPAGYEKVFERMLVMRWQVFGVYFGVGFAFLFLNLLIARFVCRLRGDIEHWAVTQSRLMHRLLTAACLAASGLLAFIVMWQWEAYWSAEAYDKEGVGRVQAIVQHQPALFGTPDNPATAAPWTDEAALKAFTAEIEAALKAKFEGDPNVLFLGVDSGTTTGAKQAPEPPHYYLRGYLPVSSDGETLGESLHLHLTGRTVVERDPTKPLGENDSYKKGVWFKASAAEDEDEASAAEDEAATEEERRAAALDDLTAQAAKSKYLKDGFCDPIFYKNVGYYLFRFPRTRYESMWILAVLFAALGLIAYQYRYYYHRDAHSMPRALRGVAAQGTLLWILILGASAWKADVDRQSMLYLDPVVNFKGSAAKSSVDYFYILQEKLTEYYIWALAVLALALLVNVIWQNRRLWWWVAVGWGSAYLAILWIYPLFYYHIPIRANKTKYEKPYLEKHIGMTRRGFKLDAIQKNMSIQGQATLQEINAQPSFLENVQLWDRISAWKWVRAEQLIDPKTYTFHQYMDVDRYVVDGKLRQTLLGAREVDPGERASRDWVARTMRFTHGHGVVAAPVNVSKEDGKPEIWVKGADMKKSTVSDSFIVRRPEIYYGEMNNDYVFVNTSEVEKGPGQREARYDGHGGVKIHSGLKRWLWATRLLNPIRVGISNQLNPNSRVLLHREVLNRAEILAPFLKFDPDPYIVIGEDTKKLWWVIDVYTVSNRFPYSERRRALDIVGDPIYDLGGTSHKEPTFKGYNYIRNSAVAVVDPYNGDVFFYVTDPHDPLMEMYQHRFAELFHDIEEMPSEIKKHLRYPDYMLWVQASMYGRYHVDDAQTFYDGNLEWGIPDELIGDKFQPMMPSYMTLTLPGSNAPEFVSVLPMSPRPTEKQLKNQDRKMVENLLSAWLVARSDGDHYGQLVCYTLPEHIDGPRLVESNITKEMKHELKFQSSDKAKISRGNLLLLPAPKNNGETALVYVEPVYSEAVMEGTHDMPRLTAVFVAAGDRLEYDDGFRTALDKVLKAGLNGAIAGRVTGDDGKPIVNVGIRIAKGKDQILDSSFWTDADGSYEFNELEAGSNYTLYLSASGLEAKSVPVVTLIGEVTAVNVVMSPPKPEKLEPTLTDLALFINQEWNLYKGSKAGLTQLETHIKELVQYARARSDVDLQDMALSANASLAKYRQRKEEGMHVEAIEVRALLETSIQAIIQRSNEAAPNGKP